MLLSAKGEHAKAVELQVRALELKPTNEALRLNLARIYLAAGDKPRARIELDALVRSGDKNPSHSDAVALLKTLD
jgi:predicted Zn-dependent protease